MPYSLAFYQFIMGWFSLEDWFMESDLSFGLLESSLLMNLDLRMGSKSSSKKGSF